MSRVLPTRVAPIWLVLCLVSSLVMALDQPEIDALLEIREYFPDLQRVPLAYRTLDDGTITSVWPSDMSQICNNDDGPIMFGTQCSGNHLVSMTWYVDPLFLGLISITLYYCPSFGTENLWCSSILSIGATWSSS